MNDPLEITRKLAQFAAAIIDESGEARQRAIQRMTEGLGLADGLPARNPEDAE